VGTLWNSCAKLRESMEMPFVVVTGVVSGIGVLDGIHMPQGEGEVSGISVPLVVTRSKLTFTRKILKCNSNFMKKSHLAGTLTQV